MKKLLLFAFAVFAFAACTPNEDDNPSRPQQNSKCIYYTATSEVEADQNFPWTFDTFGANVVSNEWNSKTGKGVITFDGDVTTIGGSAFQYCSSLTRVTIPDSVTTIGDDAFYWCTNLISITIPNSVTTIGDCAFYCCTSLTSVTIGDSVTTIGDWAFQSCYSLTSVTIGDSVTTIGGSAFNECESLKSVTIPDSVTTIGNNAFTSCSSLTSVTIPDSVTTIENYAFYYCSSLASVYCEATTPPSLSGSDVFYDNAPGRTIYVPEESVRQYKIAAGWSEYADYIVGYDFENGVVVE